MVQNKVRGDYKCTGIFRHQRELVPAWAAYLAGESRYPEAGSIR